MGTPRSTPQTSLKISSTSPTFVQLEHQGGSDIILSYARIVVEQGANRISYDPAGNSSSRSIAGDKIQVNTQTLGILINGNAAEYINSGGSPFSIVPGSDVTVTIIDIPSSNQVAARFFDMNMDFKKNEDAVSHVIDTILMIAVVVILAIFISGIIQ
jgi:FlaG/FlaF family flagellin (archaellin)